MPGQEHLVPAQLHSPITPKDIGQFSNNRETRQYLEQTQYITALASYIPSSTNPTFDNYTVSPPPSWAQITIQTTNSGTVPWNLDFIPKDDTVLITIVGQLVPSPSLSPGAVQGSGLGIGMSSQNGLSITPSSSSFYSYTYILSALGNLYWAFTFAIPFTNLQTGIKHTAHVYGYSCTVSNLPVTIYALTCPRYNLVT
jgi:hypothetical protein